MPFGQLEVTKGEMLATQAHNKKPLHLQGFS